jgi:hypothetical protein
LATFTFLISTTHNTQEEEEEEMKAEKKIFVRSFTTGRFGGCDRSGQKKNEKRREI